MRIHFSKEQRAWLIGTGISSALWIFLYFFADIYFAANDDQFLLRTFTGAAPGGAPTFHAFVSGIFAYPLSWLNRLFPNIAWFSIIQIGLMWLSTAIITKSIILCFERTAQRYALRKGITSALSFDLLFLFYLCARPTFTTTAVSLGTAAIGQLLSMDCRQITTRRFTISVCISFLLMILCFGLRQMAFFSAFPFWILALLYLLFSQFGLGKAQKRNPRPLLICMLAMVLAACILMGSRLMEVFWGGQYDSMNWGTMRSNVLDYLVLESISDETRTAVGWSDTQVSLLDNWYTMEETISTEAFEYVYEHENTPEHRFSPGAAVLDFRTLSPLIALSLILLFIIGTGCLIGLALRRKGLWTFLTLMCAAGGCLVMLIYLTLQGRLPYRAVLVPVLPAAVFVFCLMPDCLPDKRWFQSAFFALLIVCTAVYIIPTAWNVKRQESPWDYNTHAAMDEIALSNPDLLFIYSNELVNDLRPFPDFSNGVPTNLMFWGGWQRGSPEYIARMEAFGLESEHFNPEDWLRPNLRYLTLEEEPHPLLVLHLREKLGESLCWEQTKMDIALYAYRFYME